MKELGAKWDRPRPPFLWEEQVPIPKKGWKRNPFPGEKPSIDTSKNRLKKQDGGIRILVLRSVNNHATALP